MRLLARCRAGRLPLAAALWCLPALCMPHDLGAQIAVGSPTTPAPQTPIPADAITAVLANLDGAFDRGDAKAYEETFAVDHAGSYLVFDRELRRAMAMARHQCTSTIVGEPRQIGPRTLVRVRQQIRLEAADGAVANYEAHAMMAFRRDDAGAVAPTFVVEFPTTSTCAIGDGFRCPACNYQIGGAPGWLCVPLRSDRASALEAASFYLVGTDLACEVSVQIDPAAPDAVPLAERLAAALCDLEPGASAAVAETWLPPAHEKAPPRGLHGARVTITLPGPGGHGHSGDLATFHVLTFGGLQHLLLLRGSSRTLAARAADVEALLASYRLLQEDCDLALAASRPLTHHTGSTLDGPNYDNRLHRVAMRGPDGWAPQLRCGGAAFRVLWQGPSGARLWLTGLVVPAGMQEWTHGTADRYLRQLCRQQGLEPPPVAPVGEHSTDWVTVAGCDAMTRTVGCKNANPANEPAAPSLRWIHLQLHPDLLLIADGYAPTIDDEAALRRAFDTLARR